MNVLPLLLGASLVLGVGFLVAFVWAVRSGQFDDTTTPAFRPFYDEDSKSEEKRKKADITTETTKVSEDSSPCSP